MIRHFGIEAEARALDNAAKFRFLSARLYITWLEVANIIRRIQAPPKIEEDNDQQK